VRVEVAMGRSSGPSVKAWWHNLRTGEAQPAAAGELPNTGRRRFGPPRMPGRGRDWILVLADAERGYAAPGRTR
jgi:hypothetical protein